MTFVSLRYIYFFIIIVSIYYLINPKFRMYMLLIVSYFFYILWNAKFALLIFSSAIVSYIWALLIETKRKFKKVFFLFGIITQIGVLFYFKYINLFIGIINNVIKNSGGTFEIQLLDIVLPVGISFYSFQVIGYLIDVYRGDIHAERDILKYSLFIVFFPQLVAGPIERYTSIMFQFESMNSIVAKYDDIVKGLILVLYGFFLKVVVADNLAIYVDEVYKDYATFSSLQLFLAAVFFSFQIYADFGGYSLIAIGSASVLGIKLSENFHNPYMAKSIKEFWHRWHISLSTWFRDYLYIPLGGNRGSKISKYRNLILTFLVSGLWHGAGINFIVWGRLSENLALYDQVVR